MAYNILFTSMYAASKGEPMRYYFADENGKRVYTDAMLTVEATTKYILSCQHIDEIIILGRRLTYDAGDDERVLGVDDGKSFYASDIGALSTYSLFRYRLSQYIDELRIEQQDINDILAPEEKEKVEDFIKDFYRRAAEDGSHRKYNKFFDELIASPGLYEQMLRELAIVVPAFPEQQGKYLTWIKNHLFTELKDSCKMEILHGNETANIRFIPTTVSNKGMMPLDSILKLVNTIAEQHEDVDIYIAVNNDDMTDNFVMLSVLDILDTMYGDSVTVRKVYTATNAHFRLAGMIRDDTEGFDITALVAATRAFLRYGKVDMIVDYWEKSRSKNSQVEKMIYAMRRIDIGLSLCNIADIEKGILDLRDLFRDGFDLTDSDYYSKLFILMAEGIKKDYGSLVAEDEIVFIDLVKWAYRKGFYQQCLTFIESRGPRDMVSKGIFYYCDSDEERDHVLELFARSRNEMKPFEYWKMEDMDHYFLKYQYRFKYPPNNIEKQRLNAQEYVSIIDNENPDLIIPRTVCDDMQVLEDTLFAYFHISRIRNETNHAEGNDYDSTTLNADIKDEGANLTRIRDAIEYFIRNYEKCLEDVSGKDPHVVRISTEEIKSLAKRMAREEQ